MIHQPIVVHATFKLDLEYNRRPIEELENALDWWRKPGFVGKRSLAYVTVTAEPIEGLCARLQPFTDPEISSFQDLWCYSAPEVIVGRHGNFDPFAFHIKAAWVEARKRNDAQNVKSAQAGQRVVRRSIDKR